MPTVDTSTLGSIAVLLTALGLSSVSGLRAYFPLLTAAVGTDVLSSTVKLSPAFEHTLGSTSVNPLIIVTLAILAVGEFIVDKLPLIDHISDLAHTVIRPLSGAAIMAGLDNPLSHNYPWAAAVVGAILSLIVHSVKATARPVVTATTVGHGNPIVSLVEDIVTAAVAVLALVMPVLAVLLMLVLTIFVGRLAWRGIQKLRARRANKITNTTPSAPVAV